MTERHDPIVYSVNDDQTDHYVENLPFKKGDLVAIEYPFCEYENKKAPNGTIIETRTLNKTPRFGIVISDPKDRIDKDGTITRGCLFSVYDSYRMYVYDDIWGGYLKHI